MNILDVSGLTVHYFTRDGIVEAVDNVSFSIAEDETFGLVGESGSGKSTIAHSILGLLQPPGRIVSGDICLRGRNLLELDERELRKMRGRYMAMIFQNPGACLNPVEKIGDQLARIYYSHRGLRKRDAQVESVGLLRELGMPSPESTMASYPHELSGGMCQRVLIAMMLIPNPELLVADEPTTGLDVTIEAQVIQLMRELAKDEISSVLYITHDMGVIAEACDRLGVLHAGQLVEMGGVKEVFKRPLHPYTRGLLASVLRVDKDQAISDVESIPGDVSLIPPAPGCRFASRCAYATPRCAQPRLIEAEPGHIVSCLEEVVSESF